MLFAALTGKTAREMYPHTNGITARDGRKRPLAFVVNDTQEILDLFRDILEEEGYDVILNSFAPRNLDALIELNPDIVILDFLIGDEAQGWQLLQKMKMHRLTRSIPIVVCTGAVQLVRELEGHLAAKNVGVVLKPFDIDDLVNTLDATIQATDFGMGKMFSGANDPE